MENEKRTFEDLLAGIDEILRKLESDDLELEESLKLYEQGMNSYREAHEKLGAARARLARLVSVDANGNEQTVPLEISDDE